MYLCDIGLTPSQIGVILRDQHGIPQVVHLTGKKILRILKKSGNTLNKFPYTYNTNHQYHI